MHELNAHDHLWGVCCYWFHFPSEAQKGLKNSLQVEKGGLKPTHHASSRTRPPHHSTLHEPWLSLGRACTFWNSLNPSGPVSPSELWAHHDTLYVIATRPEQTGMFPTSLGPF